MTRSIMGGMGINPDALIQTMNRGMEEERQKEQTPVEIHFYHCDHLGTPIALTDQKGQIAWAAKNDPWGNTQEEFNPYGIEQDMRLPGQHLDRETGLYYNRYRYYDPFIGSYINQDPIGLLGGNNLSSYANNNPFSYADYLGLSDGPTCGAKKKCPSVEGIKFSEIGKATIENIKDLANIGPALQALLLTGAVVTTVGGRPGATGTGRVAIDTAGNIGAGANTVRSVTTNNWELLIKDMASAPNIAQAAIKEHAGQALAVLELEDVGKPAAETHEKEKAFFRAIHDGCEP